MTDSEREIKRKLRVLNHAKKTGCISKTCSFYGFLASHFTYENVPMISLKKKGWHLKNTVSLQKTLPFELLPKSKKKTFILAVIIN